jgi:nucleotide-binding universal stress UspA family protein
MRFPSKFKGESMKPLMKILVAYDGSAHANNALGEAIDLAEKFKGSITVLYVAWEKSDDDSRNLLRNAEEKLKKSNVKYKLRVERSNYTPRMIVRIAMDEAFDLIAIGSRGMGGGKGWILGSVSSRVMEEAPCPVLLVK